MAFQPQNNPIGIDTSPSSLVSVRVVDIILDATHPDWERMGGWDSLGTVFYVEAKEKGVYNSGQGPRHLQSARPLFQNQKFYPLIDEIIIIFSGLTKEVYQETSPNTVSGTWYLPNMNMWNHPHHNALPQTITIPNELSNETSTHKFKQTEAGVVLREFSDDGKDNNSVPLGDYFTEKELIKPLLPYEGDYILEGRFGNSIRFGSTTKKFEAETDPTTGEQVQSNLNNEWTVNSLGRKGSNRPKGFEDGKIGDPITIIRNEQVAPRDELLFPQDRKGWIPTVENINGDGSSIYMTSNQVVPIVVAGATDKNPYNQEEVSAKSYSAPENPLTFKDAANAQLKDISDTVSEIANEFMEFVSDPIEYLAPTQDVITTTESIAFEDGENDFSFTDALIESGQAETEDIERYQVEFEDTEISGTELSISEQQEWDIGSSIIGDADVDTDDYSTQEDYTTTQMEVRGYSVHTVPVLDTIGKQNKWFSEWKDGLVEYPCLIKNTRSNGHDVLVAPLPITKLIRFLQEDGVNAQGMPNIKNLVLHVTATGHQINHKLTRFFLWSRKWTRHGYNISVSGDGLCNYNVDLKTIGFSNGSGGNAYGKKEIAGLFVQNSNSINISWIGTNKQPLADTSITSKDTTGPNITKAQAYSYELLIKYFVRAFPNIKIVGHNQISIGKGSGKSCPCFDPVEYCEAIGVGDNVYKKHLDELTMDEKKRLNGYSNAAKRNKDMSHFESYHGEKYRRTSQYVAKLTGINIKTDLL